VSLRSTFALWKAPCSATRLLMLIIQLCASCTMQVRCYSGETYCCGRRQQLTVPPLHGGDVARFTLDCTAATLSLAINGADQGVLFSDVPAKVHPAVLFYGSHKSVRLLHLKRLDAPTDSAADSSVCEGCGTERQPDCQGT
jgi:hypothetical protein